MFTGSVNVTDPSWISRVKNQEVFPAYNLAQTRLNSSLTSLQTEQQRIQAEAQRLQDLYDQRVAKQAEDRARRLKETALEQQRQMQSLEAYKNQTATAKKEPGISPFLSGYPSIPLTPPDVRLQKKLERQKYLRTEYEQQAVERQTALEVKKMEEQRQSQVMLSAAEMVGQERQREEEEKRKKNREEMRRSWEQAASYKAAHSGVTSPVRSVAGSAISQHGWSEYADRFQGPPLSITSPVSHTIPPSLPSQPTVSSPVLSTSHLLTGVSDTESRKKIAARLKEREDQKAQASIASQVSKQSPLRSPQLQKAGHLISGKTLFAYRSLSQPRLDGKTKKVA